MPENSSAPLNRQDVLPTARAAPARALPPRRGRSARAKQATWEQLKARFMEFQRETLTLVLGGAGSTSPQERTDLWGEAVPSGLQLSPLSLGENAASFFLSM